MQKFKEFVEANKGWLVPVACFVVGFVVGVSV